MGSLMAGWDSPVLMNPDTAKLQRNKSLTKEEIHTFWKGQRKLHVEIDEPNGEERIESPISPLSPFFKDSPTGSEKGFGKEGKKASSTPRDPPAEGGRDNKNGDWWTRSNWAFLNEPPKDYMTDSAHKYTAQFNVPRMAFSSTA